MKIIDLTKRNKKAANLFKNIEIFDKRVEKKVEDIITLVQRKGDDALIALTKKFDKVTLKAKEIKVSKQEVAEAKALIDKSFKVTASRIKKNIETYYKEEKKYLKSFWKIKEKNRFLGQKTEVIENVGVYIPGGTAPLVSTVFMSVIPAQIAGVKNIVASSPPNKEKKINPYILYSLDFLGVKDIYKVGGAQAIAALALGTKTIVPVDKICGPGNIYVAYAKKQLNGLVGIDMLAGPSEVMILADGTAKANFIAADILSQAEHDVLSQTILITTSKLLAQKVKEELKTQIKQLQRKDIAGKAVEQFGIIVIVKNIQQGLELVNQYAPEHLEVMVKNSERLLAKIRNAGAIFLGHYTPVACGDFMAGPSHVLPTAGSARFSSYLSIDSFVKRSSFVCYSKKALECEGADIIGMAGLEGLDAHANSVKLRIDS